MVTKPHQLRNTMLAGAPVAPIVQHAPAAVHVNIAVVEVPVASAPPQSQKKSQYQHPNQAHPLSLLKTLNVRQPQKKELGAVVPLLAMVTVGSMENKIVYLGNKSNANEIFFNVNSIFN